MTTIHKEVEEITKQVENMDPAGSGTFTLFFLFMV
jgi:hypothetical protein